MVTQLIITGIGIGAGYFITTVAVGIAYRLWRSLNQNVHQTAINEVVSESKMESEADWWLSVHFGIQPPTDYPPLPVIPPKINASNFDMIARGQIESIDFDKISPRVVGLSQDELNERVKKLPPPPTNWIPTTGIVIDQHNYERKAAMRKELEAFYRRKRDYLRKRD